VFVAFIVVVVVVVVAAVMMAVVCRSVVPIVPVGVLSAF